MTRTIGYKTYPAIDSPYFEVLVEKFGSKLEWLTREEKQAALAIVSYSIQSEKCFSEAANHLGLANALPTTIPFMVDQISQPGLLCLCEYLINQIRWE